MSQVTNESFVTLATNTNYVLGALTLAESLRSVNTTRQLTVLITREVPDALQQRLREVFDHVELVDVLDSRDTSNLELLKRPELGVTFTKLHCWRLTQFRKCVFLDADCLVLKNVDELFERDEFAAVTDIGWPDCFNSGVFVFRPSTDTYNSLLNFAVQVGSFDGGDQGLLNLYFNNWSSQDSSKRLSFIYNMTTNVAYSYAPAFKNFRENVKIVHFIGAQKPWYYSYDLSRQTVLGNVTNYESEHLNIWWSQFVRSVLDRLDTETRNRISTQLVQKAHDSQSAGSGSNQQWNQANSSQGGQSSHATGSVSGGVVVGSNQHQNLWESGNVEYQGRDSFSNIQAHLDSQLKK
jgi:glycogenin